MKVLPLGSTPVAMDVQWRSAFQARRPHNAPPGTAYPVIVAMLRSAFQALNTEFTQQELNLRFQPLTRKQSL